MLPLLLFCLFLYFNISWNFQKSKTVHAAICNMFEYGMLLRTNLDLSTALRQLLRYSMMLLMG